LEGGAPLLTIWLSKTQVSNQLCAMRDDTCKLTNRANEHENASLGEVGLSLEQHEAAAAYPKGAGTLQDSPERGHLVISR